MHRALIKIHPDINAIGSSSNVHSMTFDIFDQAKTVDARTIDCIKK